MMRLILLLLILTTVVLPGCASMGENGEPESDGFLRNAFSDAHWGAWTPEFSPTGLESPPAHR